LSGRRNPDSEQRWWPTPDPSGVERPRPKHCLIERDIVALIDDYTAAWEANDSAAVLALMTPDAAVKAGNGMTYGVEELQPLIESLGAVTTEQVGDPLITFGRAVLSIGMAGGRDRVPQ